MPYNWVMEMNEKVIKYIADNNLINIGDKVGIGVSGGIDSMCLLSILANLKKRLNFELYCICIDHNLREDSKKETKFVHDFCSENEIPFYTESVEVKKTADKEKKTIEQCARDLRYKTFENFSKQLELDKLCLAQHKNDQAETILMHISRGSGLKGIVGMLPISQNFYIRPFLCVTRMDILNYANKNNISYMEDKSNNDNKYTRNYIRNIVVPSIEKVYPNFVENLSSLSNLVQKDDELIESILPIELVNEYAGGLILLEKAKKIHYGLLSRLIRYCFNRLGIFADVEERHVNLIIELFNLQKGKSLSMPYGVIVKNCYKGISFVREVAQSIEFSDEIRFHDISTLSDNTPVIWEICDKERVLNGENFLCFDIDKIPSNAVWRHPRIDDTFTKFGGGTKSLKKYLTDKKFDSNERKSLWVCADKNEILLVAGVEISDFVKITNDTKRVARSWIKK